MQKCDMLQPNTYGPLKLSLPPYNTLLTILYYMYVVIALICVTKLWSALQVFIVMIVYNIN